MLGFLLMTPPTGLFPVATLWVGSVVEEDRLDVAETDGRVLPGGWNLPGAGLGSRQGGRIGLPG